MESKTVSPNASATDSSIHMELLEKALKKTTSKCVSSFKFSLFKRQFEPIYKKDPKTLQNLHESATSQLTTNIQEELALMFEEEKIEEFMAKLDDLKTQADEMCENVTAWRPSGKPAEDICAHVQPVHRQHLHQLQKVFDQLQSQNTLLIRNLKKEQDKLLRSQVAVQDHLNTWKQANCLTADDRQELEAYVTHMSDHKVKVAKVAI